MATASTTTTTTTTKTGQGGGGDAEKDKRLAKVKKEIRSILITAQQTGRSPEDLERDYRDLNGKPIPFKELGYGSVFNLLDDIQDVVEVYQMDGSGELVLFAKSTAATAHLEKLIAKAKPNKLGRFGGIIQQPATSRRGTPERRKLIEKRLLDVAVQYPGYVSFLELCNAYQVRYFEQFDPKGDYGCPAKNVFTIKLAHLFDVKGSSSGGGHFSVRLKEEARKEANKENAFGRGGPSTSKKPKTEQPTINLLGAGGFGQSQATAAQQGPSTSHDPKRDAAIAAATAAASGAPIMDTSMTDRRGALGEHQQQRYTPANAVPPFSIPPEHLFRPLVHPPVFPGPNVGGLPAHPQPIRPVMPPGCHQSSMPMGRFFPPMHAQGMFGPPTHMVAGPIFQAGPGQLPQIPFVPSLHQIAIAHQLASGNVQQHFGPPPGMYDFHGPNFVQQAQTVAPFMQQHFGDVVDAQMIVNQDYQQLESFVDGAMPESRPHQPNSADSGLGGASGNSQLNVNAPDFEPIASRSHTGSFGSGDNGLAAITAVPPSSVSITAQPPTGSPAPVVVIPDASLNTSVASRAHSQSDRSASIRTQQQGRLDDFEQPSVENIAINRPPSNRTIESSVNRTVDSIAISNHQQPSTSRMNEETQPPSAEMSEEETQKLKEECKTVLRKYTNGISALDFEKAYRETFGKDLDLLAMDLLSMVELAEKWPDVFVINQKHVLSSKEPPKQQIDKPNVANWQRTTVEDPIDQWLDSTREDALITEIWRFTMHLPGRCVMLRDIPSEYQKATGKPFPITNTDELDEFGLRMFNYMDRFTFHYEGASLIRYTADPSFDDPANMARELNRSVPSVNTGARRSSSSINAASFVRFGETIPAQQLPITSEELRRLDSSDPKKYVRVMVAQIFTPGQFYVQLESTYEEYDKLGVALTDYFADEIASNEARTNLRNAKVGLVCAVRNEDDSFWYRAVIKKALGNGSFTVVMIDIGTEIDVKLDEIRYLPKQFSQLPAQAIEARLAALTPTGGGDWTEDAGNRLAEICGTSLLWAEIHHIDPNGSMEVFLTLTTEATGEELHVSDVLIDGGYADVVINDDAGPIESTIQNMSLEEEIDSPASSPDTNANAMADEEQETPESILDMSLVEQVSKELRSAVSNGDIPDEGVIELAKTYLGRRRLLMNGLLSAYSGMGANQQHLILVALDKAMWLEDELKWLNQLSSQ